MLRKYLYPYLQEIIKELAAALHKQGLKPNHLTLLGLALSFVAAMNYAMGFFFFGAMFLLTAGACDILDGALARQNGEETAYGAFFDSVVDRYSDFFIISGIVMHYMNYQQFGIAALTLVVLLGAILTSYSKARMECFPIKCDVGLIERPERLILIFIGSFAHLMVPVLWILAILSHVTVFQRIWFAKEALSKKS